MYQIDKTEDWRAVLYKNNNELVDIDMTYLYTLSKLMSINDIIKAYNEYSSYIYEEENIITVFTKKIVKPIGEELANDRISHVMLVRKEFIGELTPFDDDEVFDCETFCIWEVFEGTITMTGDKETQIELGDWNSTFVPNDSILIIK